MVFCEHCGNELREGSSFCGSCGALSSAESFEPSIKKGKGVWLALIGLGAGVFILFIAAAVLLFITDNVPGFRSAPDFTGGTEFILRADSDVSAEKIELASSIIRMRIDKIGLDAEVTQLNNNRISVKITKDANPDEAMAILVKTGLLELKKLDQGLTAGITSGSIAPENLPADKQLLNQLRRDDRGEIIMDEGSAPMYSAMVVNRDALATGDIIENAKLSLDRFDRPIVVMEFTDAGTRRFSVITEALATTGAITGQVQQLAIVLDDEVISAPTVKDKITSDSAEITGNIPIKELENIVRVLQTGALPVELYAIDKKVIVTTPGDDS